MKFLVVEANSDAKIAALKFFATEGIDVEFVASVEQAECAMRDYADTFHAVITSDYMPYTIRGEEESFYGQFIAIQADKFGLPCVIFVFAGYHKDKFLTKILDRNGAELGRVSAGKKSQEDWAYTFEMLKKVCPIEEMRDNFVFRRDYYEKTGKQWRR